MFDKFPYTNFHELNLDYFINKFNEIFTEWEQLNTTMLEWKAATDASNALWKTSVENGLAAWKTATEADLNARETALRAELAAWKTATEADIGTWETDTLAALNAWKATAEATFEAIRVQAAASAEAAQTAQTAAETAQTAAETAQTAAETAAASVTASAAQIATNTGDISDLKTQLSKISVDSESEYNSTDLIIEDRNGNITQILRNGDIQTKNFNSVKIHNIEEMRINEPCDYALVDNNGKILLLLSGGHIKTKNFDSRDVPEDRIGIKNVKDYGAKGDGITDDTSAIQSLLTNAGTIYFPEGTYIISEQLVFYSNTRLLLNPGAEIKQTKTSARCIIRSYNQNTDTLYNGIHDVIIEGGILNANGENVTEPSCLAMAHGNNIIIKDVVFKGEKLGMHAVDMAGCKNVVFENCIFESMLTTSPWGECIQIDGVNSSGSYPYITFSSSAAFYDDCGCENIEIKGCKFILNNYSPAIGNHNYSVHKNINIHDNIIIGAGSDISSASRGLIAFNIHSSYTGETNKTTMLFIHDNIMRDSKWGLTFDPGADTDIIVKNNVLYNIDTVKKVTESFVIWENNNIIS